MDKYIERLYKKYNHAVINDDGAYMSKECRNFCSYMKKQLKASAEHRNFELADFCIGHYYVSGFFRKSGCADETEKFIYFSYDVPRFGTQIDFGKSNILYRRANGLKDFTGKKNHYTNLQSLMFQMEMMFNS